jgi:hypothetical protein
MYEGKVMCPDPLIIDPVIEVEPEPEPEPTASSLVQLGSDLVEFTSLSVVIGGSILSVISGAAPIVTPLILSLQQLNALNFIGMPKSLDLKAAVDSSSLTNL